MPYREYNWGSQAHPQIEWKEEKTYRIGRKPMSYFRSCGPDILVSLDIGHVWRNHRNFVPDSTKMARLGYELEG